MFRLIFWGIVIYILYRIAQYFFTPSKNKNVADGDKKERDAKKSSERKNISDAHFTDLE